VIIASRYLTHTEIIKRGNTRESNIQKKTLNLGKIPVGRVPTKARKNVIFWREGRE
jgi:hypothetical protein